MDNVEGFLLSSLPYSTSDETKQSGNGKLFPCSMRFILSRRHLIRARRLLAGSFFILCKFKEGRVSFKYVNKRPFFMVTIWRDRWVTKPGDKTKKAGSSFLSKLGGGWGWGWGWGSLRTAGVSPRSSPLRNVSAAMSEEKRLSFAG